MNCDAIVDVTLAIGRVVVLNLGMVSGTLLVYLGWKLYRDGVVSKSSGELTYKNLRVALTAAGPGVFLALFGAFLLWSIVSRPLDLSESTSHELPRKSPTGAMLSQAATNASRSDILLVQSAPNPPGSARDTCLPCLVRKKNRVQFGGDEPITPTELENAITAALTALEERRVSAQTNASKAVLRKHMVVLEELASGIEK